MKKLLCFTVSLLLLSSMALASGRINVRNVESARNNLNKGVALENALGLTFEHNLQQTRTRRGRTGLLHTRYQQTYRGIPVWGQEVVVSRRGQNVKHLHGSVLTDIHLDNLTPAMDADDALDMMKAMQRTSNKEREIAKRFYENETSELVVYLHGLDETRLAYAVSFFTDVAEGGEPSRPYYIVDAKTGEVLLTYEGLTTADGTGPGGNAKTGQYYYGTDFPPFEVTQNGTTCSMTHANVQTIDLNNGTGGGSVHSFTCFENTYKPANGAFCPLNDAHAFGGVVFNMYNDWYNTAPLSFQLTMRVHYGVNYENAFWNGSSMTFGDGFSTFYPLVSLDVSSHEVSHGFTEQNSGLIYSGQSGGINEAFSDIAGEAAEYYRSGTNDWLVGADIFKAAGALRYMYDPPLDGVSIGSANDYYNGMDVHYSSGVFNKAFYLLSTTAGWDTHKAFDIFVKANQDYWTPSTDFIAGAQGVLDSATDLGYEEADVIAAFEAVDVYLDNSNCTPGGVDRTASVPALATGTWKYYRVTLPADVCTLFVETYGGTGDADLYVKQGSRPTLSDFDCRSWTATNNEACSISRPAAGVWWIGVHAYSASSGVTIHGTY